MNKLIIIGLLLVTTGLFLQSINQYFSIIAFVGVTLIIIQSYKKYIRN